ncbi:MAG: GGDEF domain-containing protein [Vicinamibacteria bacterium]|nr:GGDEF domain-containing protein [Vicinamibacteria bacterium]
MPPFSPDLATNLTRLGLIGLLLAVSLVVAARFRHFWGITPLAVMMGLLQAVQVALAVGLSLSAFPGVTFSPGSVVIFPATLFAILLVYVLEDEIEARRLIFGSVFSNVTLALLVFFLQPFFEGGPALNRLGLDGAGAARLARLVVIGAGLMAVDAFILVRAFEWFGDRVSRNVLARAQFALCICVAFDAICFSLVAFAGRPRFTTILLVDLVGKVAAASFYSLLFVFLLPWSRMTGDQEGHFRGPGPGSITFKDRFQDLQKVAVRDALTGVFNRAYFDHELRAQTERVLLREERLLLVLIDLDSFKRINDTWGHPAGDRVLSLFGEALRAVARQNDTVCRYGGEEFAILIAGGPSIAPVLFDRTNDEVSRLWNSAEPPFPFPAPRCSMGAASVPDDARSASELLAAADRRLYASKRAGGDRLTIGDS